MTHDTRKLTDRIAGLIDAPSQFLEPLKKARVADTGLTGAQRNELLAMTGREEPAAG